jgi:hypothetical protein
MPARVESDSLKEVGKGNGSSSLLKKNQKTFASCRHHLIGAFEPAAQRKEQEFFVSFFKIEILPLLR